MSRNHPPSALVYLQGEPAEYVWFVKRGTVVLSRATGEDSGVGRVQGLRFAGQFIALEGLVSDRYNHSAHAATDVSLCGTTVDGVDEWLGAPGTPARTALELTLRTSSEELTRRAAPDGTAVERIASWLCDEGPRGVTLTVPRHLIASLLGMRPETLSRGLAQLAQSGAILTKRNTILILDEHALAELANR